MLDPPPSPPSSDTDDHPSVEELQSALGSDFEVVRRIGEGAVAVVYLAREIGLDRPVAVKVLRSRHARDETQRLRFEREAKSAASLSHPHVVHVYRYGRLPDDTPFLVMQYVKGRTLEDRLAAQGRLSPDRARTTIRSVASALAAAHAHGIIHRDVRPANILWDDDTGEARLADFGIAAILAPSGEQEGRLTQTGQVVGNPRYLSPEQLKDEPLTDQADVYALGMTAYEIVSGEPPYPAMSNAQWVAAHLTGEPRPLSEIVPDLPADLADLIMRCLNKDPRRRPRAEDVVQRLSTSTSPPGASAGFNPSAPVGDHADIAELVKRRVPQIVVSALVVGWGIMELVNQWVERGIFSDLAYHLTLALVSAGVVSATIIAWFHGEKGKQDTSILEWMLLSIVFVLWVTASIWIFVTA